jgi:hypothetical protein
VLVKYKLMNVDYSKCLTDGKTLNKNIDIFEQKGSSFCTNYILLISYKSHIPKHNTFIGTHMSKGDKTAVDTSTTSWGNTG